jgi:hypothetical protein
MSDKSKILIAYLIVLGAILLLGCNPAQKAARTLAKHPTEAAKFCAEKFPVKDDTLYLQGGVIIDTIVTVKDSLIRVICPKADTVTVVDTKVKFRTVTVDKTRIDTITVIRENKANTAYLESEVIKHKGDAEKWKEKAQSRMQFILWLAIILVVIIVLQVLKSKIF